MGVFFLYSIPVAIYLRVSCANAPSMNKQHFHVRLCLCFYLSVFTSIFCLLVTYRNC